MPHPITLKSYPTTLHDNAEKRVNPKQLHARDMLSKSNIKRTKQK